MSVALVQGTVTADRIIIGDMCAAKVRDLSYAAKAEPGGLREREP